MGQECGRLNNFGHYLVMASKGSPLLGILSMTEAFREAIYLSRAGILWHRSMHGNGNH